GRPIAASRCRPGPCGSPGPHGARPRAGEIPPVRWWRRGGRAPNHPRRWGSRTLTPEPGYPANVTPRRFSARFFAVAFPASGRAPSSAATWEAARRSLTAMKTGDTVADFELPDQTGRPRTLSALLSDGPVVLFFSPAAMTPGCTKEACHFRDLAAE